MKVVEVPSVEAKRVYGDGRLKTIPDGWRVLRTIWLERHFAVRIAVHSWAESMRHGNDSVLHSNDSHIHDTVISEDSAWIEGRD
jgi:hypothetical protein